MNLPTSVLSRIASVLIFAGSFAPCLASADSARANLWEIGAGTVDEPSAQYIALKIENLPWLDEMQLATIDADGFDDSFGSLPDYHPTPFQTGIVYIGHAAAAAAHGIELFIEVPDDRKVVLGTGRVCLYFRGGRHDCVAYGGYPLDNEGYGHPLPGLFQAGQKLVREEMTGTNLTDWTISGSSPNGNGPDECESSDECALDEICVDGRCDPAPAGCTEDDDCEADEVCVAAVCEPLPFVCEEDSHCDSGDVCDTDSGECVPCPECHEPSNGDNGSAPVNPGGGGGPGADLPKEGCECSSSSGSSILGLFFLSAIVFFRARRARSSIGVTLDPEAPHV